MFLDSSHVADTDKAEGKARKCKYYRLGEAKKEVEIVEP
jgi:hypothetical protein